ncbi:MAG: hypothetical protein A2504_17275 [Bdellovibrionales bacterium RIFOXYD12_FULL_39_22]|nr:MAG: hypothetical protein A2385_10685 [Bdellovibrionales bacterium RIFOXYB1_FULL_39_21]OFZ40758.1 MAG: hypothetical protein A2485_17045 [Bdellovibrionales bacterium RIFOXYC12_FULL_39_17]OFZ48180.1 MAG: hypothetical protein A2404_17205 [Bdellovibrionales bacterium RIFOXYC1_FULL_39_130]OFZ75830.1 MAG: hypothetical protein A2560_13705 [Bdellovibrionales bacterium RIFOXYD1_FULL_39_84]OFZ91891.1 MAG: hypothetical protein A2504_17275 [Bdellovibrionales bacterium RIFOXYD12_FULL_39_22]HLE11400.1 hy
MQKLARVILLFPLLLELACESIVDVAQIAVPNGKDLLALLRVNGILILDSTSITLPKMAG